MVWVLQEFYGGTGIDPSPSPSQYKQRISHEDEARYHTPKCGRSHRPLLFVFTDLFGAQARKRASHRLAYISLRRVQRVNRREDEWQPQVASIS